MLHHAPEVQRLVVINRGEFGRIELGMGVHDGAGDGKRNGAGYGLEIIGCQGARDDHGQNPTFGDEGEESGKKGDPLQELHQDKDDNCENACQGVSALDDRELLKDHLPGIDKIGTAIVIRVGDAHQGTQRVGYDREGRGRGEPTNHGDRDKVHNKACKGEKLDISGQFSVSLNHPPNWSIAMATIVIPARNVANFCIAMTISPMGSNRTDMTVVGAGKPKCDVNKR